MLPRTISTSISQDAITKVTRLFNNTIGDVVAELIQNARRAGASLLELTTSEHKGRTWPSVTDNGAGIEDRSWHLDYGRSGGDDAVRETGRPQCGERGGQDVMTPGVAIHLNRKQAMSTVNHIH